MKRILPAIGLVPFSVYVAVFFVLPTILAIISGFLTREGGFTMDNLRVLQNPTIVNSFIASLWVSLLTSALGAMIGAVVAWALTGLPEHGALRRTVDAASSVLSQFGGVMLAFAFIATIGIQGMITVLLRDSLGIDIYANGVWLYQPAGLILPYLYFQVPLMAITFLPAVEALRSGWAEAVATLGGTNWHYWTRVGIPVLTPTFLGGLLLLFANAFSSYSTAAGLISQGSGIVPLQIGAALKGETGASQPATAGILALVMILVMSLALIVYERLMKKAAKWQA
ncbi:ABC transporter permease [Microbacterium azadirachtae]|uniref:Putative spermidine/putrescine transport system permease protein n=1 Tax=Microbacterium azadirachtae TaxID=582680 RepID=A0A1I6G6N5_9MICO|nr:ABC transporter permease [Microbacterium azadirachtae]SDL35914.1 putative spermidine/putrescine transport system permease protein [Microbacterium azadirachtae]SEF66650.1 putative spermidine/putrescine transport system permease protein [Microbacterium azadirachtae]SEF67417.1 putative spermidine/putrescine transport system permease protein [Microbacterium azadirachtae]SFR37863.1 putative spermidine/putrescine transport system permease protein [Microbacterium azadirachtae]